MAINIIKQSAELITDTDPLMLVEKAARVCYASLDKIQPGKTTAFISGLIKRGHHTPLEHAHVRIFLDEVEDGSLSCYLRGLYNAAAPANYPFAGRKLTRGTLYRGESERGKFVEGSLRDIAWYIMPHMDVLDFLAVAPMELAPDYAVLQLITDRAIATEFFRHRTMSYDDSGYENGYVSYDVEFEPEMSLNQQSTRYVNYTRKGMCLILPEPARWAYDTDSYEYKRWEGACSNALIAYTDLIGSGTPPEYARNVLPLSTATTVIMSGSVLNWLYLLNLRLPKGAHPQARLLAAYIWDILSEHFEGYIKEELKTHKLDNTFQAIDYQKEVDDVKALAANKGVPHE